MRPLYVQSPYVVVLFAVGLLLASREVLVRRYLGGDPESVVDAGSFRVLWSVTTAATALAVFVPFSGVGTMPDPAAAFWVGIGLMVSGFLIRLAAIATLGRLFNHRVAVQRDHAVVEDGLYRWVRHPSYTGAVLTYIGIGVVCGNWLSVAAELLGAVAGYGYRILVEERALRERLAGYAAYCERTPYRLVPFVW